MRIAIKHFALVFFSSLLCFLLASMIYVLNIFHIFSHRDTGYSATELQKAVILDWLVVVYFLPALVFSLPVLDKFASSFPAVVLISISVFWGGLFYCISLVFRSIFRQIKKKKANPALQPTATRDDAGGCG